MLLACTAVLASGFLAVLLLNTIISQGAFRQHELEIELILLAEKEESPGQQVQLAESPLKVERAARKLGMVPAAAPVFLRLSDGTVLGEPVPAAAAPGPGQLRRRARDPADAQARPPRRDRRGQRVGGRSGRRSRPTRRWADFGHRPGARSRDGPATRRAGSPDLSPGHGTTPSAARRRPEPAPGPARRRRPDRRPAQPTRRRMRPSRERARELASRRREHRAPEPSAGRRQAPSAPTARGDGRNRAIHLTFAVLMILSIYAGRVFDLMVIKGADLAAKGESQRQPDASRCRPTAARSTTPRAPPLAITVESRNVTADQNLIKDPAAAAALPGPDARDGPGRAAGQADGHRHRSSTSPRASPRRRGGRSRT